LSKNTAKIGRFSANHLFLGALMPFGFVLLTKYFHMNALEKKVESAWEDRQLLNDSAIRDAIFETISLLDQGKIRVAEKKDDHWVVNEWVKKAVILYFPLREMSVMEAGIFEFHDKIPLKRGFKELGVRVVPQAVARYGSYLSPGVIMMPSYVNIGAWVGQGSMIDTWATVGSCAQIGNQVHLSGGVGIGGVLEPVQASPVIIEDGCFIGSRCIVVEGVRVGREAVLGANVVLTQSTRIIDVSHQSASEYRGFIPERSVVIPGTITKTFPAGDYQVACALIIGKRKESTDLKTSLNEALRDYDLQA
jgi:2,3,4,5-tetrahydropyridine-2,6-dicarboxylate N-succinyltransferase